MLVKLHAAQAALSRGSVSATCGTLVAVINKVSAQGGKEITRDRADLLIQEAIRIRDVLGWVSLGV
jgi:hypothetical protein